MAKKDTWAVVVGVAVTLFAAEQLSSIMEREQIFASLAQAQFFGFNTARLLALATIAAGLILIVSGSNKHWSAAISAIASVLCLTLTVSYNLALKKLDIEWAKNVTGWRSTPGPIDTMINWAPGVLVASLAVSVAARALLRNSQDLG